MDKAGIRDVIREMLDIEEQAQQIVSDAEKQAQELLAKAREKADLRVEQARHHAMEQAQTALAKAMAEAQRSRAEEIRIQMEKDSRIVEAAKDHAQKAVALVINTVAPG